MATGISLITPIGRNVQQNWESVLLGRSAISWLPDQYGKCRIGGRLPEYDLPETSFKSKIHSLASALAIDCVADSGLDFSALTTKEKWRTGVVVAN